MINSVAALKRALTVGTVINVTAHAHPALAGQRIVLSANTVGMALSLPDGHPRKAEVDAEGGSHADWPKASEVRFEGNSITFGSESWDRDLMTFEIVSD